MARATAPRMAVLLLACSRRCRAGRAWPRRARAGPCRGWPPARPPSSLITAGALSQRAATCPSSRSGDLLPEATSRVMTRTWCWARRATGRRTSAPRVGGGEHRMHAGAAPGPAMCFDGADARPRVRAADEHACRRPGRVMSSTKVPAPSRRASTCMPWRGHRRPGHRSPGHCSRSRDHQRGLPAAHRRRLLELRPGPVDIPDAGQRLRISARATTWLRGGRGRPRQVGGGRG